MNQRNSLITASLFGALAIGLGAFGAHALQSILESTGRVDTFELAVRYQFYHTLALLATGILIEKFPSLGITAILFSIGIIIFSGSLYILSLTDQPWWGAITPVGGVALGAGWLNFFWVLYKGPSR